MTIYYAKVRALIDPEQSDASPDGRRCQDVSLILTDEADIYHDEVMRPAAITLSAEDARELAFDLLVLAEHADRIAEQR